MPSSLWVRHSGGPLLLLVGGYSWGLYGAIVPVDVVGWWATFTIGEGGVGGLCGCCGWVVAVVFVVGRGW